MKNELVSIIIPMHNSEAYILDCLDSVIGQTYKRLEVILIDDCSTDETIKKCLTRIENDRRFRLIKNKANIGSAACRNIGLDSCGGKYVMFVDSDDYIYPNTVDRLVTICNKENVDLVRFNLNREGENGAITHENFSDIAGRKIVKKQTINEIRKRFVVVDGNINCYSVLLFFKNTFDVRYRNDLSFLEDTEFYVELFAKVKSVYFLDDCLYFYRYNKLSLSRSPSLASVIGNIRSAIASYGYIEKTFADEGILGQILRKEEMDEMLLSVIMSRIWLLGNLKWNSLIQGLKKLVTDSRIEIRIGEMDCHLFAFKRKLCYFLLYHRNVFGLALVVIVKKYITKIKGRQIK